MSFLHVLPCGVFRGGFFTLLTIDQERPSYCVHVYICDPLNYRALACKCLGTVSHKRKVLD